MRVSIDVDACRGVVGDIRGFFDEAMDEWTDVANAAGRALCSTAPLKALSDPLIRASQLANELETRVELAIVYNTGDGGNVPAGGVLTYELTGEDTLANVKAQLGVQIARGIEGLDPGNRTPSREDVERFEHYTTLMAKYADDPAVTDGLFGELGPERAVEVPLVLRRLADSYSRNMQYMYEDTDIVWDENTHVMERISQLQQEFMEAYGQGLATSSHSSGFRRDHPDFAREMAERATEVPDGAGWGLSQVLRFGEYESAFLVDAGEVLYEWEKDQFGPVWGQQMNGEVMSWRLGTDDDGAHYDPFVGLFEAMGRTPQAALDFVNPDGGGDVAQERAEYLIQERSWRADDFNALGEALDAGATAFHRADVPVELQERAAWLASATVHFLGSRDGDTKIGDAGKDSLAHLLAAYVADVDRVGAGRTDGPDEPSTSEPGADFPWALGLPVGADFSLDTLNTVFGEVLTDDAAMEHMAAAVAAFNAHRMDSAVQSYDDDASYRAFVAGAVQDSAALVGFMMGNLERASEAAGKAVDERNKRFVDLTADVVGLVPTGKTFTSFLADQALSAGKDSLTSSVTGNQAAADGRNFDAQQAARQDLQIAMALALAESTRLEDMRREDLEGRTYPWFSGGSLDESVLTDADTRESFMNWIRGGAGVDIAELIPDVDAQFVRGRERGAER
ncbi:DUF6571 family protein [Cellulomonas carbonis]|uniref:DUF6571 family protein n=1 Tax=Cellulomonas carbonis TaxID=1386092 RepID=UPI000A7FC0CF|nr:DUF6571 family protein [Cellulomonas carbonis]